MASDSSLDPHGFWRISSGHRREHELCKAVKRHHRYGPDLIMVVEERPPARVDKEIQERLDWLSARS